MPCLPPANLQQLHVVHRWSLLHIRMAASKCALRVGEAGTHCLPACNRGSGACLGRSQAQHFVDGPGARAGGPLQACVVLHFNAGDLAHRTQAVLLHAAALAAGGRGGWKRREGSGSAGHKPRCLASCLFAGNPGAVPANTCKHEEGRTLPNTSCADPASSVTLRPLLLCVPSPPNRYCGSEGGTRQRTAVGCRQMQGGGDDMRVKRAVAQWPLGWAKAWVPQPPVCGVQHSPQRQGGRWQH